MLRPELVRGEIVVGAPRCRPLRREMEAHLRVDVLPVRLPDEWRTGSENSDWRRTDWILTLLEDALIEQEWTDVLKARANRTRILLDHETVAGGRTLSRFRVSK